MIQGHRLLGVRVDARKIGALVGVAAVTGQCQCARIVNILVEVLLGDDVLDVECQQRAGFLG